MSVPSVPRLARALALTLACSAALASGPVTAGLAAGATPTPGRTQSPSPTTTVASVSVVSATEVTPETEEVSLTRGGVTVTRRVLKTERTADGREAAAGRVVVRFRDGTDESTRTRVHAEAATRAVGSAPASGRTVRAAPVSSDPAARTLRVAPLAQGASSSQRQLVALPSGASVDSAVSAYRSDPRVLSAEPDYVMRSLETPNDPSFTAQWGLEKIGAPLAWNVTHGASATIAILDCGIYEAGASSYGPGHPDINAKVVGRYNATSAPDADDFCNHGTHVAGIAAASTNNGIGIAGVGYDARLLNVKVLDDSGSGTTAGVAAGITWAATNGAKVINLSLGAPGSCPATLQSAIDAAWNAGAVIVAAAGNSGASGADYPGNCNRVIAVASSTSADARSSFSNHGTSVDVAAPGSAIYSTDYIGGYANKSGTSMAAPHVAGLAALIWTLPGVTTPQQVVDRITSTADAISGTGSLWTHGRINAARALGATSSTATPTATQTQTPTATPTSASSPTATSTSTPSPTPTVTPTLDPKPSMTRTPTATATATVEATATPSPTPTQTTLPTATPVPPVVEVPAAPPPSSGGGGGGSSSASSGGGSSGGGSAASAPSSSGGGSSAASSSSSSTSSTRATTSASVTTVVQSYTSSIVQLLPTGQLAIHAPGATTPVVVQTGASPRVPDQWCPADRSYQQHIRLEDTGIAGATFGLIDGGTLDWIPPEHAGCVDWSRMDKSLSFTKEVIMQFTLERPQPGALLWVLDGPAEWNGRLYEVDQNGVARYVTGDYFQVHQDHFRQTWKNVMPISAAQAHSFASRNLIGPDLR